MRSARVEHRGQIANISGPDVIGELVQSKPEHQSLLANIPSNESDHST